jgi:hypothetical protein
MQPNQYTGKEWNELAKELTPRQMRNALKRSYRAEAKKALGIARRYLGASGMQVQGNKSDWDKGIRSHIYSKGGGFMITVKAHRANLKGQGEKSMHQNRKGFKKPVLMWAEEGTKPRQRGGKKVRVKHGIYGTHRSGKTRYWTETIRKDGISTGQMGAYGFLDRATPEMFQTVERDLGAEVGIAVEKVARKCGFIN